MKIYYYLMLIAGLAIAVYGFLVPYLVSYPSDALSFLGFFIGIGAVPVFLISVFKVLPKKFKQ